MSENILLKVHSADSKEAIHQLVQDKPLSIESQRNTVFQLIDKQTSLAPENIRVEKVGKDLSIYLDSDSSSPNVIIEKYYLFGNEIRLLGQQSLGDLKAYNTLPLYYTVDGEKRLIALNQNITIDSSDNSDDMFKGWVVAGAYLSILAVGLSKIDIDGVTENNELAVASNVRVSIDGRTVTGRAQAGTKVVLSVADKEIIVAVGSDGQFSIKLDTALTNGEEIKVEVQDHSGNSSTAVIVYAPINISLLQELYLDEIITDTIFKNGIDYPQEVAIDEIVATAKIASDDAEFNKHSLKRVGLTTDESFELVMSCGPEFLSDAVGVSVNKVADDGIIDTAEAKAGINIVGQYRTNDELVAADTVTVLVNIDGQEFVAVVDQFNQSWQLTIANNSINQAIYSHGVHHFTVKISVNVIGSDKVVDNTVIGSFAVDITALDESLNLAVDTEQAYNKVDTVEAKINSSKDADKKVVELIADHLDSYLPTIQDPSAVATEPNTQAQSIGLSGENIYIGNDNKTYFTFNDAIANNKLIIDLLKFSAVIDENQLYTINKFVQNKIDLSTLLEDQSIANDLSEYLAVKVELDSSIINIDRGSAVNQLTSTELFLLKDLSTVLQDLEKPADFIA